MNASRERSIVNDLHPILCGRVIRAVRQERNILMLHAAVVIYLVVKLGFAGSLVVAGVWAYRRFRLPSIPWLIAYLLISLLVAFALPVLAMRVTDSWVTDGTLSANWGMSPGASIALTNYLGSIVATLGHTLVAWFLLSEFVFILSKSSLGENLRVSQMLQMPRAHSAQFGVALLASLFVMPAVWLVMYVV